MVVIKIGRPAYGYADLFYSWAPADTWLAGLVWADGCLRIDAKDQRCVLLTSTDEELAEQAAHVAGVAYRRYVNRRTDHRRKPYFIVRIGQRDAVARLQAVGLVERKSLCSEFPDGLPRAVLPAFVRGYFDGNGCVGLYRNPNVRPTGMPRLRSKFTGARGVLSGIQQVVGEQAAIAPKKLSRAESVWQLNYNHRDSLLLAEFMYADGGPHLDRKRRIFAEGAAQPPIGRAV